MRKPPDKDEKVVKLQGHLEAGETLRPILEHPATAGFFNAEIARLTDKMRDAVIEDDATRRNAAIELNILGKFRMHLSDVAHRADRARLELEKLEKDANAG